MGNDRNVRNNEINVRNWSVRKSVVSDNGSTVISPSFDGRYLHSILSRHLGMLIFVHFHAVVVVAFHFYSSHDVITLSFYSPESAYLLLGGKITSCILFRVSCNAESIS